MLLAASPSEQIAWCARHEWSVDELGLDFDWATSWVVRSVDERAPGLLSDALKDELRAIDGLLSEVSGRDGTARWSAEGLAEGAPWAEVRRMAGQALDEIALLYLVGIPDPKEL